MKKKILVVSRSFYPMLSPRSFRTTELVKELARRGHKVTLITPKTDKIHVPFENEFNINIKDLGKPILPRINFRKGSKIVRIFKRALNRVLLQFFEYPNIDYMFQVKKALKNEVEYDLLISIAVPHPIHWGVAWARRRKHLIAKTWVADCGDPFYLNIHDSFNKFFYFKYIEKWYSRKTDYITIPFEGLRKYFFNEFKEKYRIIPQGFNFNDLEICNETVKNKIMTFAYAGGFMKNSRDPQKFLDYLTTIERPFKFIVYNKQVEFTNPYKKKLQGKLVVKNYISRKKLLLELSKMDFLVNFEYDPTNQAPSKLIDYSLTKRPILLIRNDSFNENHINEFLSKNYQNQFKLNDIDQFKIENVVKKFLELSK